MCKHPNKSSSNGFIVCIDCGETISPHIVSDNNYLIPITSAPHKLNRHRNYYPPDLRRALKLQKYPILEYRLNNAKFLCSELEKVAANIGLMQLIKKLKENLETYLRGIEYFSGNNQRLTNIVNLFAGIIYYTAITNNQYYSEEWIKEKLNEAGIVGIYEESEKKKIVRNLVKFNNRIRLFDPPEFQKHFTAKIISENYSDYRLSSFAATMAYKIRSIKNPLIASLSAAVIVDYANSRILSYSGLAAAYNVSEPTLMNHTRALSLKIKESGIKIPRLYDITNKSRRKKVLEGFD